MAIKISTAKDIVYGLIERFKNDNYEYTRFLKQSSHYYKQDFNNKLLIYAQQPEASLVAPVKTWTEKFNREVITGSTAIITFDMFNFDYNKTKFLIDITQTKGDSSTYPILPKITEENQIKVLGKINKGLESKESVIENAFTALIEKSVERNISFFEQSLKNSDYNNLNKIQEITQKSIELIVLRFYVSTL